MELSELAALLDADDEPDHYMPCGDCGRTDAVCDECARRIAALVARVACERERSGELF